MNSKYKKGLHWIIAGDTNDLKLESILQLNSNLKQVVQLPTRLNPPRILDPIITSLSSYYQVPKCLPPLDPESNGKPSDHQMVTMTPISMVDNKSARFKKKITYRPFNKQGLQKMQNWLSEQKWNEVLEEKDAHKKAEILQHLLVEKYDEFFPEKKTKVITSNDQPYYTEKLSNLKGRSVENSTNIGGQLNGESLKENINLNCPKENRIIIKRK